MRIRASKNNYIAKNINKFLKQREGGREAGERGRAGKGKRGLFGDKTV